MQLDLEMAAEDFLDDRRFAPAEQPVIDENAGELIADRLVDERSRHAGIDAAA